MITAETSLKGSPSATYLFSAFAIAQATQQAKAKARSSQMNRQATKNFVD